MCARAAARAHHAVERAAHRAAGASSPGLRFFTRRSLGPRLEESGSRSARSRGGPGRCSRRRGARARAGAAVQPAPSPRPPRPRPPRAPARASGLEEDWQSAGGERLEVEGAAGVERLGRIVERLELERRKPVPGLRIARERQHRLLERPEHLVDASPALNRSAHEERLEGERVGALRGLGLHERGGRVALIDKVGRLIRRAVRRLGLPDRPAPDRTGAPRPGRRSRPHGAVAESALAGWARTARAARPARAVSLGGANRAAPERSRSRERSTIGPGSTRSSRSATRGRRPSAEAQGQQRRTVGIPVAPRRLAAGRRGRRRRGNSALVRSAAAAAEKRSALTSRPAVRGRRPSAAGGVRVAGDRGVGPVAQARDGE